MSESKYYKEEKGVGGEGKMEDTVSFAKTQIFKLNSEFSNLLTNQDH